MEEMKAFVCSPEAGKAAKEAGLFDESVWVWVIVVGKHPFLRERSMCRRVEPENNRVWENIFPAVMLEEAINGIGKIPGVRQSDDDFSDGFSVGFMFKNIWYNYPTGSDEAVRLAVRIKEWQA